MQKSIEDQSIKAGVGLSCMLHDFCFDCGNPILNFLKKHKLEKEEKLLWENSAKKRFMKSYGKNDRVYDSV